MQTIQRKLPHLFHKSRNVMAWALALCTLGSVWSAQPVTIEPAESWFTLFAAKDRGSTNDVDVHLVVKAAERIQGRLSWSFLIDQAAVERREVMVQATPDQPVRVTIRLHVPHVRDGLVVAGQLAVSLSRAGNGLNP